MTQFPYLHDEYSSIYLEDTDRRLPSKIDPNLRYAYFKIIAKGGKAVIKSCKDLHLSRVICYKTLLPEFADDPIEQLRLLREARVTAMLQHPNTVPTYEIGRDKKGHIYFTMKLVHGYTMREILDYRERYDLKQLVNIVVQIAHALEYAHLHGVVHRDIKPENILIGSFGEVVLLDWGLAKVWNSKGEFTEFEALESLDDVNELSITQQGKIQGTIRYMSPEQINRDTMINTLTDIYSLGVVLYEILCGENPMHGDTVDQVIAYINNTQPQFPSEVSDIKVPFFLEKICMQCLKKDPKERIQNASELIRLLNQDG